MVFLYSFHALFCLCSLGTKAFEMTKPANNAPIYKMVYLGNFSDIDPNEQTIEAESATRTFAGKSFGTRTDPLYGKLVDVMMNDRDGDGIIKTNNWSGTQEKISYTLPGGLQQSWELDAAFTASQTEVTLRLKDGTMKTVRTTARVFQDVHGNTFLIPPPITNETKGEVEAITTYPIIGVTFPKASLFKTDYNAAYAGRYNVATFVPCFTADTMILTDGGERAARDLKTGDMVWTCDHGYQPIRWIGTRRLSAHDLASNDRLHPIRIRKNALGSNRPSRDLLVSPQHRVLVRSSIAQRMFATQELLIAACKLTEVPGIDVAHDLSHVTYVHLMLDRHEVLMSDGTETESLFPGPQVMAGLGQAVEEILTLFPHLRDKPQDYLAARPFAQGRHALRLAHRHVQNGQSLTT